MEKSKYNEIEFSTNEKKNNIENRPSSLFFTPPFFN